MKGAADSGWVGRVAACHSDRAWKGQQRAGRSPAAASWARPGGSLGTGVEEAEENCHNARHRRLKMLSGCSLWTVHAGAGCVWHFQLRAGPVPGKNAVFLYFSLWQGKGKNQSNLNKRKMSFNGKYIPQEYKLPSSRCSWEIKFGVSNENNAKFFFSVPPTDDLIFPSEKPYENKMPRTKFDKGVKRPISENYETWRRKVKRTQMNGKIFLKYGLEELALLIHPCCSEQCTDSRLSLLKSHRCLSRK